MDPWDIVSDPFERPKIYRHKTPLIKIQGDGKGVYLFVIDKRGVPPIALHDMGENTVPPELRFLVDNEPIEIGSVGRIPNANSEGYLNLSSNGNEWTLHRHAMQNLDKIPKRMTGIPFRLKSPEPTSPKDTPIPKPPHFSLFSTPTQFPTQRGVIEGPALLVLRHAIMLSAYINRQ